MANINNEIRVTIKWDSYNHRRYSNPWIAKVTEWNGSEKPDLEWGQWLGTSDDGGELEVFANPGDIIRWGQKDYRKIYRGINQYGIVRDDRTIEETTPAKAKRHWIEHHVSKEEVK